MNDPTTLVLSGTAGKGIYILGALFRIQCQHIRTYIGTSSGGIICLLLSCGFTPYEVYQHLLKYDNPFFANIIPSFKYGILNTDHIFAILQQLFIKLDIDLQTFTFADHRRLTGCMLMITAYNITKHREEVFSAETFPNMPITNAIKASIGIPILFRLSEFDNNVYIDGGLWNNLPISYCKTKTLAIVINKDKIRSTPLVDILSISTHYTAMLTLVSTKTEKILMFLIGYIEAAKYQRPSRIRRHTI